MRILIAVDFGLFGKAQIEALRKLGSTENMLVKVLHVIEPLCWELQTGYPATMALSDSIVVDRREAALDLVHEVALQLREIGVVTVDVEVLEGSISDQILEAAESFAADLLMVGSHGKSTIARFLLGSVSQEVSAHAKCSVLIARPEQTSAERQDKKENTTHDDDKQKNGYWKETVGPFLASLKGRSSAARD